MLEVVMTGYHLSGFENLSPLFKNTSSAIYFSSHVFLYAGILIFVLSHINKTFFRYSLIAYSWIFISESHHAISALAKLTYSPGSLTSLLYIVLGYFYVSQLIKDIKLKKL